MTDRYENIRRALEMGPTPGEWYWSDAYPTQDGRKTWSLTGDGGFGILSCDGDENSPQSVNAATAELIAACDPDTIRELLDERDALEAENERLHEQLRLATVDQAIAEAEASDAHAENKRLQESLAAHHAMPGESCALVDWWSLETTLAASHLPAGWRIEAHEEAAEALKKEREAHAETNRAMTNALLMMEEREQRDEALLRQALERLEAVVGHFDPYMGDNECRPMENARITIAALRERLMEQKA